jgi:hypothetical protein
MAAAAEEEARGLGISGAAAALAEGGREIPRGEERKKTLARGPYGGLALPGSWLCQASGEEERTGVVGERRGGELNWE